MRAEWQSFRRICRRSKSSARRSDEYDVVSYIEPVPDNVVAIGLDLSTIRSAVTRCIMLVTAVRFRRQRA